MEKRHEVKAYKVEYECPVCKKGTLVCFGPVTKGTPPMYPSKCSNEKTCHHIMLLDGVYPRLEFE